MQPIVEEKDSEMKVQQDTLNETNAIDLVQYRQLVRTFIDLRRYKTALFWAEKVVVLGDNQAKDIYWLAHCMFLLREYDRAAHTIKIHGLETTNIYCHHLVVECYYEAKEYTEAMDLLNSIDLEYISNTIVNTTTDAGFDTGGNADETALQILANIDTNDFGPSHAEVISAIYYLKGKILEAMDNRNQAMNCYIEALHLNVYCTEALDALVQHEMLLASEEHELITHLPFDTQCTDSERKIIELLYRSKLKKYNETSIMELANLNQTPGGNFDSLATIKSIIESTEKIKTERSNSELKLSVKGSGSKFFTPVTQNVKTPSPSSKDLKTPNVHTRTKKQETPAETPILNSTHLRRNRTNRSDSNAEKQWISTQLGCERLEKCVDLITGQASELFYNSEYKHCIEVLDEIFKVDPYYSPALIILIGCLIELKEYSKLFCIAHKLVDLYSDEAISWYAVGCYYDLIGKSDQARRYLSKATSIDRLFGPAWLAYGHSFAKENEHDQAMAAYFKATQLMRGCHLPLLYIGVECGLTKNYDLSQKFFYQAMSIAPLDVFVLHELGVIKFEYEFYEQAEEIFRITLDMVTKKAKENKEPVSIRWEPLINNLGHCCRKNKKYDEALNYHKQALALKPQNSTTYTAIGFVHALKGNLECAVDYLHRSLGLKRDDIVTTALLKSCLEDLMIVESLPKGLSDSVAEGQEENMPSELKGVVKFEATTKLKGIKITYDDDSNQSQGSEMIDLDMSMDV